MCPSGRTLPAGMRLSAASATKRSTEQNAESIRSQGVLSPLLVRPLTDQSFEIVAGARRYRAAQIAEAPTVPVRVVNLTDAEALEAQLIELSIVGKSFLCLYATWHVVYM
jgi:ParB-like chromosome segregation protein Spo0J